MFARILAGFWKLHNRVLYPAPKSLSDVIAKALHEAKDEHDRDKAKEARRIIKDLPRHLKSTQLDEDDTFRLCSVDAEHDLTDKAYSALANQLRLPTSVEDFLPQSTPYLVLRTLQSAGQRVMINGYRYGERSFLGFKIPADDEDSIRLELRFIVSESNY
ncbi:MAG: hypothetical protein P4L53_23930 [Candidatus Obscuribacterales bacterium]|nr:hypothetical protein [Candidatus Obscuribacterales bacterium]